VDEEVEVRIPDVMETEGGSLSLERKITRVEFASLVQDLIQRTFKVCDEALQQSDLTTRDLDGVILVGGPTRLPVIRQAVCDYFQQEPKADVDPDEVVAMGAAIHAASLVNADAPDSVLLDVTPLDLRIGVAGGLAEPVIERNTPVPIEQTRRFTTVQDDQQSVKIRVYQGDSRQSDENEMLGQFEFSGFAKARRGEVNIDVTFEINADGIVEVTAADPATGQRASTSITLSSGLTAGDMQKILEQDRTARVATPDAPGQPAGGASPAAPAALPASDEIVPLDAGDPDDDDIELLEGELDEIELLDEEMDALAASGITEAPAEVTSDPNALSASELDGAPDEAVPLADAAEDVNERAALFDASPVDLSASEDDSKTE
jgi:hypothetical protein